MLDMIDCSNIHIPEIRGLSKLQKVEICFGGSYHRYTNKIKIYLRVCGRKSKFLNALSQKERDDYLIHYKILPVISHESLHMILDFQHGLECSIGLDKFLCKTQRYGAELVDNSGL